MIGKETRKCCVCEMTYNNRKIIVGQFNGFLTEKLKLVDICAVTREICEFQIKISF